MNNELNHIKNWFNALKFTIFHKMSRENDIPLRPFVLKIDKAVIERKRCIKFYGALTGEHLIWNHDIHFLQSKVSKNIKLIF